MTKFFTKYSAFVTVLLNPFTSFDFTVSRMSKSVGFFLVCVIFGKNN